MTISRNSRSPTWICEHHNSSRRRPMHRKSSQWPEAHVTSHTQSLRPRLTHTVPHIMCSAFTSTFRSRSNYPRGITKPSPSGLNNFLTARRVLSTVAVNVNNHAMSDLTPSFLSCPIDSLSSLLHVPCLCLFLDRQRRSSPWRNHDLSC